jgi:hypothetical protein
MQATGFAPTASRTASSPKKTPAIGDGDDGQSVFIDSTS